jgi:hypothetical protein
MYMVLNNVKSCGPFCDDHGTNHPDTSAQAARQADLSQQVIGELPAPPCYLPFQNGRYQVTPNLFNLGTDFGNGTADGQCFQIDREFDRYCANKTRAREENLAKYLCGGDFVPAFARHLNAFIVNTLCREHPSFFHITGDGQRTTLECRLTGDTLVFNSAFEFDATASRSSCVPGYETGFDALAMQVQEDLAVLQVTSGSDKVLALHLCAPNHWAPADKIGRSFVDVHQPVAGMDAVNRKAGPLLDALLHRGPYVRFAWGLATDRRLNHHPEPPAGQAETDWGGRNFDPADPKLFVRVERQTLHGFADFNTVLFTIRTYFYDLDPLIENHMYKENLVSAIESMSPEQLRYKGLFTQRDAILAWLK